VSSTQICSVKSAYRKYSTRLAYVKKRASMLCSYQYGSIASKSRVSARVNKTQCLLSCHSLLLQGASSEPIIKGNGTVAGSRCNMALNFDTTDNRNTLKQTPVSLTKQNRMCFQCSDTSFSCKYSFTFSLKAVVVFGVAVSPTWPSYSIHSDDTSEKLFPQSFRYSRTFFSQ